MYIYIYIYIYIHTYIYIFIYLFIYLFIYITYLFDYFCTLVGVYPLINILLRLYNVQIIVLMTHTSLFQLRLARTVTCKQRGAKAKKSTYFRWR